MRPAHTTRTRGMSQTRLGVDTSPTRRAQVILRKSARGRHGWQCARRNVLKRSIVSNLFMNDAGKFLACPGLTHERPLHAAPPPAAADSFMHAAAAVAQASRRDAARDGAEPRRRGGMEPPPHRQRRPFPRPARAWRSAHGATRVGPRRRRRRPSLAPPMPLPMPSARRRRRLRCRPRRCCPRRRARDCPRRQPRRQPRRRRRQACCDAAPPTADAR